MRIITDPEYASPLDKATAAMVAYGNECRREGLESGLYVAELWLAA